jgi:hypothetical protein
MTTLRGQEPKPWWRRIRRAFGIPDLVTDEHARELIVMELSPAPQELATILDPRPLVRAIVEAVIQLGSRGELDDLATFKPGPYQLFDRPQPPTYRVIGLAKSLPGWPALGPGREPDLTGLIGGFLDRIKTHLENEPFEDSTGRYFA